LIGNCKTASVLGVIVRTLRFRGFLRKVLKPYLRDQPPANLQRSTILRSGIFRDGIKQIYIRDAGI
jgi:hypothetical protein